MTLFLQLEIMNTEENTQQVKSVDEMKANWVTISFWTKRESKGGKNQLVSTKVDPEIPKTYLKIKSFKREGFMICERD